MAFGIVDSCFKTYGCGVQPSTPYDGAVFEPYVKITFGSDGDTISVGNKSYPPYNSAVITSFEWGLTPGERGYGADVEILDVGGRCWRDLIRSINKTLGNMNEDFFLTTMDWGWSVTKEDGSTQLITASSLTGLKYRGLILQVNTEFSGGDVRIKFSVRAPQAKEIDAAHAGAIARDGALIPLMDGIQKLFTEVSEYSRVRYRLADGTEIKPGEDYFFDSIWPKKGPNGKWELFQTNVFSACQSWLNQYRTKNRVGTIIIHDFSDNSIIIAEDPLKGSCCDTHVGTFVVNGGNRSPVLSFNPNISWPKGFIPSGGGVSGGASNANEGNRFKPGPVGKLENAGTPMNGATTQEQFNNTAPNLHAPIGRDTIMQNAETNNRHAIATSSGLPGWTCELRIFGDPFYSCILPPAGNPQQAGNPRSLGIFGKSLSIIFLNPWYIEEDKPPLVTAGEANWIQDSVCNGIISNKKYMILGVSHQISNGKYTTTFRVMLLIPNKDIAAGEALGGDGCGTEVFKQNPGASEYFDYNDYKPNKTIGNDSLKSYLA